MPIIKSAKKALRQSKRRKARNLVKLTAIRKLRRDYSKLIAAGKKDEAQKKLPLIYQALDKAAKTGVIKWNAASRKKSRLAKSLAKVK